MRFPGHCRGGYSADFVGSLIGSKDQIGQDQISIATLHGEAKQTILMSSIIIYNTLTIANDDKFHLQSWTSTENIAALNQQQQENFSFN